MRTCSTETQAFVSHTVALSPCCPMSGNPLEGSTLTIFYRPNGIVLPVEDLADMVAEYVGGRGKIRGMEEMIQEICTRSRDTVKVPVRVVAKLLIKPPFGGDVQGMTVKVKAGD